ncbi:DNA-packaging protein [Pseudomonas mosselii]|uniref:DNA-packaging protein n=1 Tax=Pseudomonas mosselii TaxID=78327 RepID=A0A7W2JVK0_9PSED|nr:DNA-packaging protein [Pseudomonas mosselii]MBA6065956.1 DNA-packaging protein [Pseudomonas mosselii]
MSLIKPVFIWLVAVAVCVGGLMLNHRDGYDQGFAAARAKGDEALAKKDSKHEREKRLLAEGAAVALKAATDQLLAEQARGNQLAADLGAKKDELRAVTDKLTGEIQHVTTLYRRSLETQPEPLPPAAFTVGFVRVWNSALFGTAAAIAVPSSGATPSGADAASARAGAADDLIAGVTRADLLANHLRNSEGYATCRAQLNKLIEWNTSNGRK